MGDSFLQHVHGNYYQCFWRGLCQLANQFTVCVVWCLVGARLSHNFAALCCGFAKKLSPQVTKFPPLTWVA